MPRIRSTGTPAQTVPARRGFDLGVGRAVVVVAEPQVEHVPEEVEVARLPDGPGQKRLECRHGLGAVRGEMYVAREQEHHARFGAGAVEARAGCREGGIV